MTQHVKNARKSVSCRRNPYLIFFYMSKSISSEKSGTTINWGGISTINLQPCRHLEQETLRKKWWLQIGEATYQYANLRSFFLVERLIPMFIQFRGKELLKVVTLYLSKETIKSYLVLLINLGALYSLKVFFFILCQSLELEKEPT